MKELQLSLFIAVAAGLTPIDASADGIYVSNRSGRAVEQFASDCVSRMFATDGGVAAGGANVADNS